MTTNQGAIIIELNEDQAPATVDNFLRYVEDGFYEGTIFHRVIPGFMIQGGGYDSALREQATRAPIANEAHNGLSNARGTIAMARTANPHSATAQFFINLVDNAFLDKGANDPYGYAVFGQVIAGMDVVDAISQSKTGAQAPFSQDVPRTPIIIKSIEINETNPTLQENPA
ncbi:peptidyl-prolyl cis-trans isomerase [Suttonella sp. R2A3]|nr:peptidylprolyl isomerase [Suttonella sp. R2A3]UJF25456.1 peptidyl-prolyl cis-trans isomerase [Suttonella sp. R2A3]